MWGHEESETQRNSARAAKAHAAQAAHANPPPPMVRLLHAPRRAALFMPSTRHDVRRRGLARPSERTALCRATRPPAP